MSRGINLEWDLAVKRFLFFVDLSICIGALATALFWVRGEGVFYSTTEPVLSPFTSISLFLMSGSRLALAHLKAFPTPLAMAAIGLTLGGNLSSIMAQLIVPGLLLFSFPGIVPTSIMTSVGLILFCIYQLLVILRETPKSAFILDDVLLHLALLPGGISLLGHALGNMSYVSSSIDPRSGIGLLEMLFMGSFAIVSALSNPNLFLWQFLKENHSNKIIFLTMVVNQYVAPLIVGALSRGTQSNSLGVEFFVMLAGVVATLVFLAIKAVTLRGVQSI